MDSSETKETKNNAGKILDILCRTITGVSIQELCEQLALSFSETIDAIRWISKDFNVGLEMRNNDLILIGIDSANPKTCK